MVKLKTTATAAVVTALTDTGPPRRLPDTQPGQSGPANIQYEINKGKEEVAILWIRPRCPKKGHRRKKSGDRCLTRGLLPLQEETDSLSSVRSRKLRDR